MASNSSNYRCWTYDLLDPVVLYTMRLLWNVLLLHLFLVFEML
jgi:hypothetical protein